MGIPGYDQRATVDADDRIYEEIGKGERIALAKLAVQTLERENRPFRLAIDAAIWQIQAQSGRGGRNPALRTLFYRICRLLCLGVQPLFVFDGPQRPQQKRGAKICVEAGTYFNKTIKALLDCFGCHYHDAPGEAEAECAMLQKYHVVDAVLSEDVDTIMFGSRCTLRNFSSESVRSNHSPTHVHMHTTTNGLDAKGMILAALMSKGDYDQAGLVRCGIKVACQAARAGFGAKLDALGGERGDQWRKSLQHELRTNESGFFSRRNRSICIPTNFPDPNILGYYLTPAVSSLATILEWTERLEKLPSPDVPQLRRLVAEQFDWTGRSGALKLIRALSPAILVLKLFSRGFDPARDQEDLCETEAFEMTLVENIRSRRVSPLTDGEPELQISYIPQQIVPLKLEQETPTAASEGINDLSDLESPKEWDSQAPQRLWLLESYLKLGVPLAVETFEDEKRTSPKKSNRKVGRDATLHKYFKTTKPASHSSKGLKHESWSPPALDDIIRASGIRIPSPSRESAPCTKKHSNPPPEMSKTSTFPESRGTRPNNPETRQDDSNGQQSRVSLGEQPEPKHSAKLISLRESLEGAWKRLEDDHELDKSKVLADVQIVDLTGI